jgi:hypothetical protein
LKALARSARTEILATKFFDKILLAPNESEAAFYMGFGGVALTALTAALESRRVLRSRRDA